jgi:kynurenine formamidase
MTAIPGRDAIAGWRRGSGWGWIWGDGDQIGALNAITPESILEALRGVAQGRVFDLGLRLERESFVAPVHARTEVVADRTPRGLFHEGLFPGRPGGVSFNTSMVLLSDHAGTQIDGLCHATFGHDHHWYNGFKTDENAGDFGPERASADNIPPIVVQAVLADVAGYLDRAALDPHFAIGPDLLAETLAGQETKVAPGEAVFVRTGALRHWGPSKEDQAAFVDYDTAGITLAAAQWLVEEQGAIFVGSDTSTVEVIPPVDGDLAAPVHKYLLVDQGVHMGELHYLEELAEAGVYRFCYIALTPKVRGTTAGFALRPIALI